MPEIGDRVRINPKKYENFHIGEGWGTIVGFNPYRPTECIDVKFDKDRLIVSNVRIADIIDIEYSRVS